MRVLSQGRRRQLTRSSSRLPLPQSEVRARPPRPESDSRLRVNVLGSLTITPTDGPVSDPVRAIVAYLAMHAERPLALDEIQNAIWPLTDKGHDIKRSAMHNYMANARKAVGDRHLPTASGRPGYQLVDSATDWNEFQVPLAQAASAEKEVAREVRKEALSLVRGEPFAADTRAISPGHFPLRSSTRSLNPSPISRTRSEQIWCWTATFPAPNGHCARAFSVTQHR